MGEISKINIGGVDYAIRDKVLEQKLGDVNAKPMISVTYTELVTLRDKGELIAGMQYRITDYVTTTAQENTRSAGHPFDVIVTADSADKLNEVARVGFPTFNIERYKDAYCSSYGEKMAYLGLYEYNGKEYYLYESKDKQLQMLVNFQENFTNADISDIEAGYIYKAIPSFGRWDFEGTGDVEWLDSEEIGEDIVFKVNPNTAYFHDAEAKLEAWQLWYSLDNNAERFAWADAENGKGVIYRLIDEWNNDCPYDFKNIIYVFNKSFMYNQWGKDYQFVRDTSLDKVIEGIQYYGYTTDILPNAWTNGKCWVADENVTSETQLYNADGSTISYGGTIFNINDEVSESYTFNEGVLNDFSLEGEYCYGNTILAWKGGLNKIVFKNDKTYEYQGQLLHSCHSNTFGNNCYSNSFGNDCYSNSLGNSCHSNTFGNSCHSNTFGYGCYSNTFGNSCHSNTFGYGCYSNSFGNDCYSNSFGNRFEDNTFDYNCAFNVFGSYCNGNTFGYGLIYNTFGNNCYSNSFGNDCINNSFGNGCGSAKLDNITTQKTASVNSNGVVKVFNLADLVE